MESENDEFEQEEEDFDVGEEQTKKSPVKASKVNEEKKPTEKYAPFYQEQRIGIMNTLTGKVEIEGFENPTIAKLEAIKLNILDKIAITTGVQ